MERHIFLPSFSMYEHSNILGYYLGVDIGGSHISSALMRAGEHQVLPESFCRRTVSSKSSSCRAILGQWVEAIRESISNVNSEELKGIGIAMPGPFDYEHGISLIDGVDKYQSLFGINIKTVLRNELDIPNVPIVFENDASCFGLGERLAVIDSSAKKIIAITLGTGFGATFIDNGKIIRHGCNVPKDGALYDMPFRNGIAEDYISTRGILKAYAEITGTQLSDVKQLAERASAEGDPHAIKVFTLLAEYITDCLTPWIKSFQADCLVIGGSIAKSSQLFLPQLTEMMKMKEGIYINIKISNQMEMSAIAGAADLVKKNDKENEMDQQSNFGWRKSSQSLMPALISKEVQESGEYNIYPYYSLTEGKIFSGYTSMAEWILLHKTVIIDGYIGNDWNTIREKLNDVFLERKVNVLWYEASAFLKSEQEINSLVKPFLGESDSVWGTRTTLELKDFFHHEKLSALQIPAEYDLVIFYGIGASLSNWKAPVIYIDLPKNEIQYRMRAGSISNLGTTKLNEPAEMYKRFYFVDWVVLNEHRLKIKDRIYVVADGQWKEDINWSLFSSISIAMDALCKDPIRVRPWFEAGAWGGQWLKQHIPSLNKDEINYAWSFELIVPENGIVFEKNGHLLEISFDWLMEQNSQRILGRDAERFGSEFPIRFDFLDTFDGGNLSIQCHPSLQYIRDNFGERITQDETYYILDCKENATVYLGFQEDINPAEFKIALEKSFENNTPVDINKFVQSHNANKHDFFLIPNGTVHSAGANNLVLEISATPYIFTFKMYDWIRPDLNGNPRPINIDHAFNNLKFQYKGEVVNRELISKPYTLEKTEAYELIHYPTHADHFYDVHRIDFSHMVRMKTNDQCHVMMLVEGESVLVKTKNGKPYRFNYAETFVIPANAEEYEIINDGKNKARVIKAFIK